MLRDEPSLTFVLAFLQGWRCRSTATCTRHSVSLTGGCTCTSCSSFLSESLFSPKLRARLTTGFVEAGGCVPEKFDAVEGTSNIDAEYGNQVREPSSVVPPRRVLTAFLFSHWVREPTSTSSRGRVSDGRTRRTRSGCRSSRTRSDGHSVPSRRPTPFSARATSSGPDRAFSASLKIPRRPCIPAQSCFSPSVRVPPKSVREWVDRRFGER